jgi:hypothetical protein
MNFELKKDSKDLRLIMQGIDPRVSGEIINKQNIITTTTYRRNRGCPNIRMYQG